MKSFSLRPGKTSPSLSLTRLVSTSVLGCGEVGPRSHITAFLAPSSSLVSSLFVVNLDFVNSEPIRVHLNTDIYTVNSNCMESTHPYVKYNFYHNVSASAELPRRYHDVLCSIFTALPKATLTVEPNPVFPGETVTLMCSVRSDSIWSFKWYKDWNYNVVSQSGYSNIGVSHISRAAESDQGQYWCEGNRVSRPTSSQPSNAITVTVKGKVLCSVLSRHTDT
jgi:hypothetical protein